MAEVFKLIKPSVSLKIDKAFELLGRQPELYDHVKKVNGPEYLYWDKARFKAPSGVAPEDFWALVKALRAYAQNRIVTVVRTERDRFFTWQPLPGFDEFLHYVDMNLGGVLETAPLDNPAVRQRYITRGIMEEAIASSQLEGAHTTRKAAKRMLLEKRKPRNESEQMILNNYEGMLLIEERLRYHDLNIDTLFELHATLTRDTIDDADVGRLRRDTDNIEVSDPVAGITYHIPPAAKFLKEELTRFVKYANDNLQKHVFVHPVIKAIILHFWVGYLHPFTDGNGRLARAVFYWYLLKKKYWAFAYLPLSKVIKNSPVQYGRAYVYSEQDDCDLTYFIDYNIRKISQAQREFGAYVSKKQGENSRMAELAQSEFNLNDRQIQLLRYLHKNPEATTTIKTHSHVYEISRPTATKDLERLEQLGFLVSRRLGQKKPFRATEKTKELFD